jgi:ABC-type transport system substrate-binding protein
VIHIRPLRLITFSLITAFTVSACLGEDVPTPTPTAQPTATPLATPTPPPTQRPRARELQTMVVMAPDHPKRLLPPASNATERLLADLLYDPLYRLDERQQPVPELARALPTISADGKTWEIPIRRDARFHDSLAVTPEDVMFSLRLAASPACPLGPVCVAVRDHMLGEPTKKNNQVVVTLREPHAPFLTEALGRLPILSEDAVKVATKDLIDAAERLNENRPDKLVTRITDQMTADECFSESPPDGCRLSSHRNELENVFRRARLDPPSRDPFTDETGLFDEDAYLGELLERIGALGKVFNTTQIDKRAAALGLLDATVRPLGGGPYFLEQVDDEGRYILKANRNHTRNTTEIDRIEVVVERDPAVAVGQLLSGEADWVLEVGSSQSDLVIEVPGVNSGPRPLDLQRGILFNVRPDRVYFDISARRAFDLCLDRHELGTQLDEQRALATTPYAADTWATPDVEVKTRDVEAANELLESSGWQMATDDVRVKDGTRLSTTIAVRPTSVSLFTFANDAAAQLTDCGIELVVEELDLTGDTMLNQLLYPNDFDTLLLARPLGADPDSAVSAFESSRITTEENQADANPSGFTSSLADHFIAVGRESLDVAERTEAYAEVQTLLEKDIPYWPLWYDTDTGAISSRVIGPDGPIDPTMARYDWDVSGWSIEGEDG